MGISRVPGPYPVCTLENQVDADEAQDGGQSVAQVHPPAERAPEDEVQRLKQALVAITRNGSPMMSYTPGLQRSRRGSRIIERPDAHPHGILVVSKGMVERADDRLHWVRRVTLPKSTANAEPRLAAQVLATLRNTAHQPPPTHRRTDAPTHRRTDAPTHRRTDAPTHRSDQHRHCLASDHLVPRLRTFASLRDTPAGVPD
ncbi:hypothetical protein [Blastococcus sp. KM273128]|uniref:hypothetical protein n=1 Tax=Blastococcus sp. KM273128 TaxID=2570314 RepID=UPI001F3F24DD|nr:hypothetical protein [Blastococcus sp. KM273128]